MKTVHAPLLILVLAFGIKGFSQDDKYPVAENDFATTRVLQTFEIMVLENDFAYDGHPFKVRTVIGGYFGTFVKTDTSIFYTAGFAAPYHIAVDTFSYVIIDLENNLVSGFADVYIEVTNDGFDKLDINGISCRINAYGLQYWDMYYGSSNPKYEAPKGSGVSSIFNQALWIGGKDESGDLHMAAERYRMQGTDFYGGPVMDSLSYSNDQDIKWHKVWKLSGDEISYHLQHWQDAGYEPVENIKLWPGTGDISLGQSRYLAPYFDRDGDGIYDPLKGDCPIIKGDQAIFVLNNDDRGPHLESGGKKLGVEIQTLYYAFRANEDSALKYTTFADQRIINRSDHSYHDVYTGQFIDFDLGFFDDDFLHCDTALQSAICYNGEPVDGDGNTGGYGAHPPAQSYTSLNHSLDGFVYFFNYGVPDCMLDPEEDWQYYNFMQGFWNDSTPFTYGGNGYGGVQPVRHIFTGDPVTGSGWTEFDSPVGPSDRRGLASTGPFELNPGDTIHLEYALVFARDFQGNNLASVALLENRIQNIRDFYQNSLGYRETVAMEPQIDLFPNPCNDNLFVTISRQDIDKPVKYFLYDVLGKQRKSGSMTANQHFRINTDELEPGLYLVRFDTGHISVTKKFIRVNDGN